MVINDDIGRRTAFSYGKLFGYTNLTDRDNQNIATGVDYVIERTRRLLYVCCSRSEKDFAVIIFVPNVQQAYESVLDKGYFDEGSIHTAIARS